MVWRQSICCRRSVCREQEGKLTKDRGEGWDYSKIWTPNGSHVLELGSWSEADSVWTLLQMVLVTAASVGIPTLTYIELIVHAKWEGSLHRVGYTYHSCWKSSQTEPQSPRKDLTSTHNLWVCVILKAAFQVHSAFFCLPLVSQTFSCLAALPWLPPHRLTVEEAGMCVKE